jgi:SAM-dependent methyltransferase
MAKTEPDYVGVIGGTFEDTGPKANLEYNRYDKKSREGIVRDFLLNEPKGSLVDVGCSKGVWYEFFKGIGYADLHGIELDKGRCEMAEKRGYKAVNMDAMGRWPYKDRSFDAVVCIDVLVHILQRKRQEMVLREASRVLSRNGVLVLSVASERHESLNEKISELRGRKRKKPGYCKWMTVHETEDLLRKSGLSVERVEGCQFIIPSFVMIRLIPILPLFDFIFGSSPLKEYGKITFFKARKI